MNLMFGRGHKFNAKHSYVSGLCVYSKDEMLLQVRAGRSRDEFTWFGSKAEARRYVYLLGQEQVGAIAFLSRQPPFDLVVNGILIGRYYGDFRYLSGGKWVIEDVKGMVTAEYKLKRALMLAIHGIRILEIGLRPPSKKKKKRAAGAK